MGDLQIDGAAASATSASVRAAGTAQIAEAAGFAILGASPAVDVAAAVTAWQTDLRLTGEALVSIADGIDTSIDVFGRTDSDLGAAAHPHAPRAV